MIKRKADVQTSYHTGSQGHPMVNVKTYASIREAVTFPNDVDSQDHPDFDADWIEQHVSDEDLNDIFYAACEWGYEMLQQDAEEIFGPNAKVYAEGRSGGWAVVHGLAPVESWDAIALGKWKRFAGYAEAQRDDIPREMASIVYLNIYLPMREKQDETENDDAAAQLPIVAGI